MEKRLIEVKEIKAGLNILQDLLSAEFSEDRIEDSCKTFHVVSAHRDHKHHSHDNSDHNHQSYDISCTCNTVQDDDCLCSQKNNSFNCSYFHGNVNAKTVNSLALKSHHTDQNKSSTDVVDASLPCNGKEVDAEPIAKKQNGADEVNASDRIMTDGGSYSEELTQLWTLYEERGRNINELTCQIETLRQTAAREKRILLHQLAIAQDQNMGGSMKECPQMLQEKSTTIDKEEEKLKCFIIDEESLKSSKSEETGCSEMGKQQLTERKKLLQIHQRELEKLQSAHEARCKEYELEIERLSATGKKGNSLMKDASTEVDKMIWTIAETQKKHEENEEQLKERMKDDFFHWERERNTLRTQLENTQMYSFPKTSPVKQAKVDGDTLAAMREMYIRTLTLVKEKMLEFVQESRTKSMNAIKNEAQREKQRLLTKLKNQTCLPQTRSSFQLSSS